MISHARCLILLGLLLTTVAFGQEVPIDDHVCNDEFARFLVDQQVSESRSVAETDKRIRILTKSADFIWKFDQPKAREYFAEAFKVATDRFNEKGFERKEYGGGISSQLPDYRFEVLRSIAKHDGAWARKLTEELLKEYEATSAKRDGLDNGREIDSLLSIALDNVKTNPALSWYLYRRLMKQEVEHQWFWTLFSVYKNDPAFADQLYSELLVSHANALPSSVGYLSAYPFGRSRVFGHMASQYIAAAPDNFAPKPQLQSRFIDLLLRRSDAFASDPANYNLPAEGNRLPEAVHIVTALQELEPIIIQSFPAFLPRLSAARSKAMAMLNEESRNNIADRDKQKETGSRSFDQRIIELEKADKEGKLTDAMILSTLISGPTSEEHFKRFEPWIDKMTDPEGRVGSANYFWFLRAKLAIKEMRIDDAQKFAAKVPEVEHQAIIWFEIAEKQLADINDAANAYQTLLDVAKIARRAEDSVGKARVFLGLANLYEKLNHSFAISELSDAVAVINKLKDADLQAGWILRHIKVKDMGFGASFSTPGYDLENTFTTLSKTDFSLPLSNAKAIDDKYFRTLAVIAIAKNCIDRPKPKSERR